MRTGALALALLMMLTLGVVFAAPLSAASKITETVNLSRPEKNMRGSGYYWNNREDTLTLDGLYIDTTSDYGLRIPDGATVILKGKNYITASKAALTCAGNVIFKGDGELILTSDDMGIYFYSTKDSTTARFLEGTYTINAGGDGIHSEYTSISFVGNKLNISAPSEEHFAINGREIKLYGGTVTLDNSVHTTVSLDVRALSLSVTSAKAALSSDKTLKIDSVALKTGSAANALAKVEEYTGENCVTMTSTASHAGQSIFFGENVPKFVDILLMVVLLALIAAAIAVPCVRSYKKSQAARAAIAETLSDTPNRKKKN